MAQRLLGVRKKGPDMADAATVGEPSLVESEPVAVNDIARREAAGAVSASSKNDLGVTIVDRNKEGADAAGTTGTGGGGSPFGNGNATANAQPAQPDPNELRPTADPNELKPTDDGTDPTLPPPAQVNEITSGQSLGSASSSAKAADNTPASDKDISSSKKKKKKGLKKLNPF
jgi:outer membrane protein assembly factor BamD